MSYIYSDFDEQGNWHKQTGYGKVWYYYMLKSSEPITNIQKDRYRNMKIETIREIEYW